MSAGATRADPGTIAALIDAEAHPIAGRSRRLRRAARAGRRRPLRPARRGVARHARVLPRARRDHEAADRGEGLRRGRRRGRLARRLPRQPLRPRAPTRTPTPSEALRRASSASRPGCGATPTCSTSSAGCAPTTSAAERPIGFYGLDLYSLYRSIEAVIAYLDKVDPPAAAAGARALRLLRARSRRARPTATRRPAGSASSCREGVHRAARRAAADRRDATCAATGSPPRTSTSTPSRTPGSWSNAEEYYRTMFRGPVSSWNLRDSHMAETLDALIAHLERRGARARRSSGRTTRTSATPARTEMGARGELNVGQLVRERHGRDAVAGRLHHLQRHRDARPPTGTPRRAQAGPPGASPGATRRCSTSRPEPLSAASPR